MSESETTTRQVLVHLITPGVGVRDYQLSEGETLADLLRQSMTPSTDQTVFVDGLPPEEFLPMRGHGSDDRSEASEPLGGRTVAGDHSRVSR